MPLTHAELLAIARAQKGVLWCIPANFFILLIPAVYFILTPIQMIYMYRLAKDLQAAGVQVKAPWIWSIGLIVPLLNLFLMLLLSKQATFVLQEHGAKVGLMGANMLSLYTAEMMDDDEDKGDQVGGNNEDKLGDRDD